MKLRKPAGSVVATRQNCGGAKYPALKGRAKVRRRYAANKLPGY